MKPTVVSAQEPDPDKCQALVITDLLGGPGSIIRQHLGEGLGVRPGGRLDESVIGAAYMSDVERGQRSVPQCTRKPADTRDGFRVCRTHKKARYFLPWTPLAGMRLQDAARRYQAVLTKLKAREP